MPLEIKVPSVGESITEVMIVKWLKSEGDRVETDDPVAEIETDKATLEIPSPGAGTIAEIKKKENEWADVGEVVATLEEGAGGSASKKESSKSADKGAKSEEPKEKPTQPDESPKQEASADSAQE
ncbi:MAG: dihydrolipoamide succinyltransferase, partial [Candidatus Omnitrophica bacterium]|nr:dihydrolipoamide succinyltransferase [Candidatus Omnitrophota bacterium]